MKFQIRSKKLETSTNFQMQMTEKKSLEFEKWEP